MRNHALFAQPEVDNWNFLCQTVDRDKQLDIQELAFILHVVIHGRFHGSWLKHSWYPEQQGRRSFPSVQQATSITRPPAGELNQ
jgi:hypothetical protein